MSTITLKNTTFKFKLFTTVLAIVSAVLLPQLFHTVGLSLVWGVLLESPFCPCTCRYCWQAYSADP